MIAVRSYLAFGILLSLSSSAAMAEKIAPIARTLPPEGMALASADREALAARVAELEEISRSLADHPLQPDADVYLQAVRMALQFGEFYRDGDLEEARNQLNQAAARMTDIRQGRAPWSTERGRIVRGYRSAIDGSSQPYGLWIPPDLDLGQAVPLYVWLHGRGDQTTNLAFVRERQQQDGQITPPHAIVLHPFGRHCVGYKSAGEVDVLEALAHVTQHYPIDPRRVVLMGFSMGGAGCWHLGAHYADRWVAMSPGAGFAETAQYQRLRAEEVPDYERQLWGVYDVPGYVRNLFNLPVIAYSGENDKQIQAAQVMAEAWRSEGGTLDHRIGPGMGHKYHPDTLADIMRALDEHVRVGQSARPTKVALQTRTLRYGKMHWIELLGLEAHWRDSRVDAEQLAPDRYRIETRNVTALRLHLPPAVTQCSVTLDGESLQLEREANGGDGNVTVTAERVNGRWQAGLVQHALPRKRPGLQGPIDDAFWEPFLVVLPTGKCEHTAVQDWVDFESQRFLDRWQGLFRGTPRVKRDVDVTAADCQAYHLVLWGDPAANQVLNRLLARLPVGWTPATLTIGERSVAAATHVPVMIYPNPAAPDRYVVLNSGPTFREGHDRTNSQQNPKLPDWAIIDLAEPPSAIAPGRIVAAEFFSDSWEVRSAE